MSNGKTHETVVGDQFGARAEAYLTSAVHAQGEDLPAFAALLRGQTNARVLDLGCGAGHASFTVAPLVREVIAYDLSPEMLAVVARAAGKRGLANLETREGLVETLPFADAGFDAVISRYSAHHWGDFDAGLREAARVLKPGGTLAVLDSVSPGTPLLDTHLQAIEVLRDCSHVRSRSRPEWEAAIIRAGLVPRTIRAYRVRLDFAPWAERMRAPQLRIDAIRSLQTAMSDKVARYFEIAADGSFTIDAALFEAMKPAR